MLAPSVADEVFCPRALLEKNSAEYHLDKLNAVYREVKRKDGHAGVAGENKSDGEADAPDIHAVENEGQYRPAAGAEGKICGVDKGIEGHHYRAYQQELCGKVTDAVRGVI